MNKTYQVRILLSVLAFILILSWDFFYYLSGYHINWPLDLAFTVVVLAGIWTISGYVDRLNLIVSDLNKREKEAHELTERLNRITDNLQEIVFETNEKGEIIFLNQAWKQMTGYDIEECLGTMYNQYFDQEEHVVQHLLSVIKEHKDEGRVELDFSIKKEKRYGEMCIISFISMNSTSLLEVLERLQISRNKSRQSLNLKDQISNCKCRHKSWLLQDK
ncbi:PAS domain-containing protein [Bacillus sp. 4A_MP2]